MTTSFASGGKIPEWNTADRVRKARESAGMKQDELASRIGMSRGGLAKIEQGKSAPRRTTIIAIAFATGVALEWLEYGETPAPDNPGGGDVVRHQGIEPRTHCLSISAA